MTMDAKTIIERLKNRSNDKLEAEIVDGVEHYKNSSTTTRSGTSALEILKRIKIRASDVVSQTSKTTFSFNRDKRPDIIEWLKEKQIQHNTDYNYMVIHFEDIDLAMEFKLIFC